MGSQSGIMLSVVQVGALVQWWDLERHRETVVTSLPLLTRLPDTPECLFIQNKTLKSF